MLTAQALAQHMGVLRADRHDETDGKPESLKCRTHVCSRARAMIRSGRNNLGCGANLGGSSVSC